MPAPAPPYLILNLKQVPWALIQGFTVFSFLFQLKNAMYGKDTSVDDPLLQRVWTHSSNPAKELLLSLGFDQVITEGNQKLLQLKWDSEHIYLEDVYVAVFVLCSK